MNTHAAATDRSRYTALADVQPDAWCEANSAVEANGHVRLPQCTRGGIASSVAASSCSAFLRGVEADIGRRRKMEIHV
jgi:hypothetical protein